MVSGVAVVEGDADVCEDVEPGNEVVEATETADVAGADVDGLGGAQAAAPVNARRTNQRRARTVDSLKLLRPSRING